MLVDLVLAHADHNGLVKGGFAEAPGRYQNASLGSSAWLFLYETEVRGWKAAGSTIKIGQSEDPKKFFKLMKKNDVHFYDTTAFGVSAFPWNLGEDDFFPTHEDTENWLDFDGLDVDDDDDDDYFVY